MASAAAAPAAAAPVLPTGAAARATAAPPVGAALATKRVTFAGRSLPYLLLAPQFLILIVFFFWPTAQALVQAFFISDAFGGNMSFVGLENFTRLLASRDYLASARVTLVFSVATTALSMGLGLAFALLVDRLRHRGGAYRTLLVWPYAVAPAIAGVLWLVMLDPTIGIVAYVLNQGLGLRWQPFLEPAHGMTLVVLAAAWKQVSYNFVFFLAGLQSIPRALVEAAALDGAGAWMRLRRVVLPLLWPTTFFLLVLNVAYAFFDTFGIIYSTTAGGPAGSTTILVYKVYRDGFVGLDLGSSSAQSVILMALVIGLTVLQFRVLERRIHYA